jgi:hypothetical protein
MCSSTTFTHTHICQVDFNHWIFFKKYVYILAFAEIAEYIGAYLADPPAPPLKVKTTSTIGEDQ